MTLSEPYFLSKGFQEIGELKWLPNETADLRSIDRRREHLTAVSACQNHFRIRLDFRGHSQDLVARGSRNGDVQQYHVDLVRTKDIDCS